MRTWIAAVLFCLVSGVSASGETLGDVDGDGEVGLNEAVHALQVTSGQRYAQQVPTFDLAGCLEPVGSEYLYKVTTSSDNTHMHITTEAGSFEGKDVTEIHYHSWAWEGIIEYIFQDLQYVYMLGYEGTQGEPYSFVYSPYRVLGARSMQPGDRYINFVEQTPGGGVIFRQHEFLGVEDVTVPAGSFTGCLKMLQRRENGIYRLSFLAPGVGLVKYMAAGGGGYKWELIAADVGGTAYPAGSSICRAAGTIGGTADSPFEFYYTSLSVPIQTYLQLPHPTNTWDTLYVPIESQDGVSFSTGQTYYPPNLPQGIDVSLSVDNGTVSGHIIVDPGSNPTQVDLSGTVTCN